MVDYQPLGGSSYIELPKDVYDTKAIVNVKNQDQECFKWSVLAALHPAEHHAERIAHYQPFKDQLNFEGIDFPVTIDQISKFEKQNPGISVTVIGIEEEYKKIKGKSVKQSCLFPKKVPGQELEKYIVLLYWEQNEQYHYEGVKNFNRLLSRTKSHHEQTFFCQRCLQGFIRPDLLIKHKEICNTFPPKLFKSLMRRFPLRVGLRPRRRFSVFTEILNTFSKNVRKHMTRPLKCKNMSHVV